MIFPNACAYIPHIVFYNIVQMSAVEQVSRQRGQDGRARRRAPLYSNRIMFEPYQCQDYCIPLFRQIRLRPRRLAKTVK